MKYFIIGLAILIVGVFLYGTVRQAIREKRYYERIAEKDAEYYDQLLNGRNDKDDGL